MAVAPATCLGFSNHSESLFGARGEEFGPRVWLLSVQSLCAVSTQIACSSVSHRELNSSISTSLGCCEVSWIMLPAHGPHKQCGLCASLSICAVGYPSVHLMNLFCFASGLFNTRADGLCWTQPGHKGTWASKLWVHT